MPLRPANLCAVRSGDFAHKYVLALRQSGVHDDNRVMRMALAIAPDLL